MVQKAALIVWFIFVVLGSNCQVLPGAARSGEYLPLLKGKKVGVVANAASVVSRVNTVDTLLSLNVEVVKVFTPEHGFRLDADAGDEIANQIDPTTLLPVISLYGDKKKPGKKDLAGIEVLVFDLQDVGVRFYTYISTLTFVMEACAEQGIPVVVFDRPNPNGFYIDGPILETGFTSFVGMHPVPIVYGMTIGEYALMVNGEGWLTGGLRCDLRVILLSGYTHTTPVDLAVKPSPNLPSANAILLYPSVCLFEGTVMSVGRGTQFPFEVFGHPEMKGSSFSFVPEQIRGMSNNPPYLHKTCMGMDLRNFYSENPTMMGRINLGWLMMGFNNFGSHPDFFNAYFDKLAGNAILRHQVMEGKNEQEIRASWQPGLDHFRKIREKYLLYP